MSTRTVTMRYGQSGQRSDTGERQIEIWSNASPSSNFSAQTVTVSNAMTMYDRIRIDYKYTTSSDVRSIYVNVSDFSFSGAYTDEIGLISRPDSNGYVRRATMASSTTVQFTTSYRLNASGNSTSYAIPVGIYGVKL